MRNLKNTFTLEHIYLSQDCDKYIFITVYCIHRVLVDIVQEETTVRMSLSRLLEQCICETASDVDAQCSAHNASHLVHVSIHGLNKWVMPGAHSLNLIICQPLRILPAPCCNLTFKIIHLFCLHVYLQIRHF